MSPEMTINLTWFFTILKMYIFTIFLSDLSKGGVKGILGGLNPTDTPYLLVLLINFDNAN